MYGDQFYHTTQMLFPIAIVIKQATGVWTLANVDKSQYDPLIDRVLPIEEIAQGHEALETRAVIGKVVMNP